MRQKKKKKGYDAIKHLWQAKDSVLHNKIIKVIEYKSCGELSHGRLYRDVHGLVNSWLSPKKQGFEQKNQLYPNENAVICE